MESTALKAENLKPVILKAGVPLAVSLAGLIYAWIMTKKSFSKVSSLSENETDSPEKGTKHEENFHNLSSMDDDDDEPASLIDSSVLSGSLVIHDNPLCLEQEITALRSQIEGLQMRELALRLQFDQYCEMKEQESLLMEIKHMLSLETARVEFLDKEISSIETETMRLENFVVQYLRIIEQLEYWKSENKVLHRKVQKLLRKSKAQSHLIKKQNLKIKEEEEEIMRNHDALQTRTSVINKLEGEIRELQRVLDQFQDEKNELLKKLDTSEAHAAKVDKEQMHRKPLKFYLQLEPEDVRKEDYNQLLNELEQVKKERAIEVEELNHLRRINAWLKQELMRHHEQQQDHGRDHIELEFEGSGGVMHYDSEHELHYSHLEHHNVSCIGFVHGSKRRKLLKRLKRWVEGSEKVRVKSEEKNGHEIKCFGSHSVSYGSKKVDVPSATGRFCSSA